MSTTDLGYFCIAESGNGNRFSPSGQVFVLTYAQFCNTHRILDILSLHFEKYLHAMELKLTEHI